MSLSSVWNYQVLTILIFLSTSYPVLSEINSLDLADYTLSGTYDLPPGDFSSNPSIINAHEASAVTYNWDTDTLFVVGDEGGAIVEVDKQGNKLSQMVIIGFNDPEGLTYVGDGRLVIVEERNRDAYQFPYTAASFIFKSGLTAVDLGTFVNNIGVEGISYDPRDGSFITVKEKSPQEVNINSLDFTTGSASISALFTPTLGVADIADVQILATVNSLIGSAEEDNLLLFSQESSVLLEVDRAGNVLSQFDFTSIDSTAEGVTIDQDGVIYVVAENGVDPQLYVLTPPAPQQAVPMLPMWSVIVLLSFFVLQIRHVKKTY